MADISSMIDFICTFENWNFLTICERVDQLVDVWSSPDHVLFSRI